MKASQPLDSLVCTWDLFCSVPQQQLFALCRLYSTSPWCVLVKQTVKELCGLFLLATRTIISL